MKPYKTPEAKSMNEILDYITSNYDTKEQAILHTLIAMNVDSSLSRLIATLLRIIYPDRLEELASPAKMTEFIYNNILNDDTDETLLMQWLDSVVTYLSTNAT